MGHGARIIPARFVKPYGKSNKTVTADAPGVADAVTRPTIRCGSADARTGRYAIAAPYLRETLTSIANGHTESRIEDLIP